MPSLCGPLDPEVRKPSPPVALAPAALGSRWRSAWLRGVAPAPALEDAFWGGCCQGRGSNSWGIPVEGGGGAPDF